MSKIKRIEIENTSTKGLNKGTCRMSRKITLRNKYTEEKQMSLYVEVDEINARCSVSNKFGTQVDLNNKNNHHFYKEIVISDNDGVVFSGSMKELKDKLSNMLLTPTI